MDLNFVTTTEAARRLGVSVRRVEQMATAGDLTRVARGLVNRTSVENYRALHRESRTRVWAEHTAWGAVALLAGQRADWLGQTQASRLRSTLRQINVDELIVRACARAEVHTLAGHSSVAERISDQLVVVGRASLGLAGALELSVDGYLSADALAGTVRAFGLTEDDGGTIVLRATHRLDLVEFLVQTERGRSIIAALDAASSLDARERGLAERALADVLAQHRG